MRVDEIERYLTKEMSPEEREHFEKEMENEPSLKFDMLLVACVIRKTKEVYLRRDCELVTRMCQNKSNDRRRYVATVTIFFISAATMVACLFFGIKSLVSYRSSDDTIHQGVQGEYRQDSQEDLSVLFNYPANGQDVNGDRLFPDKFKSPQTLQPAHSEREEKTDKGTVLQDETNPVLPPPPQHVDLHVSSVTPVKEEGTMSVVQGQSSISELAAEMESYFVTVTAGNGVWGAVKRAFMYDKNSLQIDIVLNSKRQNTDIDEESFMYKTYMITDAGKKKSLYDFRYGTTRRSSFYLEKEKMTNISLYFRGVKNQPSMLRELRIPAIHQDFVFRNITIK